ncbi:MAG: ribosomal L7Ae/L30e/S12e/Gadd45 family protein [Clostridia bacterium]|nr:ribosomal L7Ae/L30e/S12e/Gadd45 family protein [Clostridia bacterium]
MDKKVTGFLGLIRRAGKLVIGCDPVVQSMADGKSKLVVMASDISANTKKVILRNNELYNVKLVTLPISKEELSIAVGKSAAVISVEDEGFAAGLLKKIAADKGGITDDKV